MIEEGSFLIICNLVHFHSYSLIGVVPVIIIKRVIAAILVITIIRINSIEIVVANIMNITNISLNSYC